jgi:hypothetical protein
MQAPPTKLVEHAAPASAETTTHPPDSPFDAANSTRPVAVLDIPFQGPPFEIAPFEDLQLSILGSHELPDRQPAEIEVEESPSTPTKLVVHRSRQEVCETLASAAEDNDLPAPFFIRLLLQESGFRPGVVSPVGAQGVAQFMPATAAQMGLDNPFDPLQAIPASARLLRNLFERFGNLGLAAAAYNAGPRRIQDWLSRKGKLPAETRGYVKTITGRKAENWKDLATAGIAGIKLPRRAPCQREAGLHAWDGPDVVPIPPPSPRTQPVLVASAQTTAAPQPTDDRAEGKTAAATPQTGGKITFRKNGNRVTTIAVAEPTSGGKRHAARGSSVKRTSTIQLTARQTGKGKSAGSKSKSRQAGSSARRAKLGPPLQLAQTHR